MVNTQQSAAERSNAFLVRVEDLVKEIVLQNGISVYRIELGMENNAGLPTVKIITYSENPISAITNILGAEFDIEHLTNNTSANKFSSLPTTLTASLKANRQVLTEYKAFGAKKFSIQICSVLQDAWAGLGNELGVESSSLSDEAKKNLHRVNALIETADLEFSKIGQLLGKPNGKVSGVSNTSDTNGAATVASAAQQSAFAPQRASAPAVTPTVEKNGVKAPIDLDVPGRLNVTANGIVENAPVQKQTFTNEPEKQSVATAPDEYVQMTDASLREYVLNSKLLKEVDSQIAKQADARLTNEIDIEGDVERLKFLKVYSLKQLTEKLSENKADIAAFADRWIGKDSSGSFEMGISLFYLEYLLVAKKNDPAFAVEYVLKFISDNEYSARYIVPTYEAIQGAVEAANTVSSKFSHLTLK